MAPTTPAPSPAKVCIVCKQDCSTRPRNKDEQGRYTCQDCAKKMATAGASRGGSAPAASPKPVVKAASSGSAVASAVAGKQAAGRGGGGPGGMDDGLSKLAADPLPAYMFEEKPVELTAEQETCQNCGNIMRKSHVLCIKCGHNKQNHKTLHTALKRPEIIKDKSARRGSSGISLDGWPAIASAVVGVVLAIGLFATADSRDVAAGIFGIAALGYMLMVSLSILISAFVTSLVDGLLVLFLPFYVLYYVLAKCDSAFVKYSFGSYILVYGALMYSMYTKGIGPFAH